METQYILREQLNDLYQRQKDIQNEIDEIQSKLYGSKQEKLRCLTGKFFKTKDTPTMYYYICNVPEVEMTMTGYKFNGYQIPAYRISKAYGEFNIRRTTMFSKALDAENPLEKIKEEYEEMTRSEFEEILAGCITNLLTGQWR